MFSKSSNISVFPLAKSRNLNITDGETIPGDRHLTEASISNLVRQLIDKSGFVISFSTNDNDGDNAGTVNISFNLYGYYFNVKNLAVNSIGDAVFASISISNNEISGQDNTDGEISYYEGVDFTSSEPNDTAKISLKILEKVDGTWGVPVDSWVKLTTQSFTIGGIDGKRT